MKMGFNSGKKPSSFRRGFYNPSNKRLERPEGLSFGIELGGEEEGSSNNGDEEVSWCCLAEVELKVKYQITNLPTHDQTKDPNYKYPEEICYKGVAKLSSKSTCYIDLVKCKGTTSWGFLGLKRTSCDMEWKAFNKNQGGSHIWATHFQTHGWLKLPCCAPQTAFDENSPGKTGCPESKWNETRDVEGCIKARPGYWGENLTKPGGIHTVYLYGISHEAAEDIAEQLAKEHWIGGSNPVKVKLCCSDEFTTDYQVPS